MRRRALLICRHDYWPALTPEKLWELDADMWPELAIACDQISAQRAEERAEIERMRTRR